jgi:hypothetical protein
MVPLAETDQHTPFPVDTLHGEASTAAIRPWVGVKRLENARSCEPVGGEFREEHSLLVCELCIVRQVLEVAPTADAEMSTLRGHPHW